MGTSQIDLSSGLQPAAPPSNGGGIDLTSGLQPAQTSSQQPTVQAPADLTDNAAGEGTYKMQGSTGTTAIPYSKVKTAQQHGYTLTDDDAPRYEKDSSHDPIGQLRDINTGVTHALSQTGRTGEKLLSSVPVLGKILQNSKGFQKSVADDEARANETMDTGGKMAGNAIENILELAAGDEALKGLTAAEQLSHLTPIAKFLEKSPRFATMLDTALKQGALGTAQAAGHGESAGTSLMTGAIAGTTGAAITAGGGKIAEMLANRAPSTETIAGEEVPVLSSQKTGAGSKGNVTTKEVPKFAARQQASAPKVFRNVAQRATRQALEEANVGRVVPSRITDPARMLPAPEDAQPYSFTLAGPPTTETQNAELLQPAAKRTQAAFKQPSYVTSSAPESTPQPGDLSDIETQKPVLSRGTEGSDIRTTAPRETRQDVVTGGGDLTTASPEMAQTHLSRLEELIDNPPPGTTPEQVQSMTEARDQLQDQMDMYHSYQRTLPNFQPIDAVRAAASVGHFGEAADQLQNAAKPIYQKIDAATDGEFGRLNKMRAAAGKRGDLTAKYEIEDRIDKLITDSGAITPAERQQATRLWSTSKVLGGFDDVINRAANVDEKYADQVANGRTFSGTRLQKGLQGLISKYGIERLESVVGKDGMENMTRMADLLKSQPRSRVSAMTANIYHALATGKIGTAIGIGLGAQLHGYEGAAAGAMVGAHAERAILRYIATNPQVGSMFDYAVRNDVTPKIAAGLIASEIRRQHDEPKEETDGNNTSGPR